MVRTIVVYAVALAAGAAVLNWLQYRHAVHAVSGEIYVSLVAAGFVALGVWMGARLTPRPRSAEFKRNEAAIRSLGLTRRECQILDHIASGQSNKEIARSLSISPSTVKTHVARVLEKLDAPRRVQAIRKARALQLIP